jgi:hypothetical protein
MIIRTQVSALHVYFMNTVSAKTIRSMQRCMLRIVFDFSLLEIEIRTAKIGYQNR